MINIQPATATIDSLMNERRSMYFQPVDNKMEIFTPFCNLSFENNHVCRAHKLLGQDRTMLVFVSLWIIAKLKKSIPIVLRAVIATVLIPACAYSGPSSSTDITQESNIAATSDDVKPDDYLSDLIYADLMQDPLVEPSELIVEVESGVVTLRGLVGSLYAKRCATKNIRNKLGVRKVINLIRLYPDSSGISDEALSATVSKALQQNPYLCDCDILVNVSAGVVTLGGRASGKFERNEAIKTASMVKSVESVVDCIIISRRTLFDSVNGRLTLLADNREILMTADSGLNPGAPDSLLIITVNGKSWTEWLKEGNEPQPKRNSLVYSVIGYREHENFNFVGLAVYLINTFILKDSTDANLFEIPIKLIKKIYKKTPKDTTEQQ